MCFVQVCFSGIVYLLWCVLPSCVDFVRSRWGGGWGVVGGEYALGVLIIGNSVETFHISLVITFSLQHSLGLYLCVCGSLMSCDRR